MPIDEDIKPEYPDDWQEIREAILKRASWTIPPGEATTAVRTAPRCEQCGKPHGKTVVKGPDGHWVDDKWADHPLGPPRPVWRDADGEVLDVEYAGERSAETVDVVLTLSHTCHDPRCDERDHLEALCQRCHLARDGTKAARDRQKQIKSEIRGQQSLFGAGGCGG